MRRALLGACSATLLVAVSCGSKQLALSTDPIDRAATCAVVSAAESGGDLDFEAQSRVIHHAMLAAADGQGFSAQRASAVVARMDELKDDITSNKWRDLIAPCDRAYPQVKKTAGIELPKARFEAELGCYSMGDFLAKTVSADDRAAKNHFARYNRMRHELDDAIGRELKARAAGDVEKSQALKQAALVRMAKLGAPSAVMNICVGRFA
jgi:hypothetical protein